MLVGVVDEKVEDLQFTSVSMLYPQSSNQVNMKVTSKKSNIFKSALNEKIILKKNIINL